MKKMRKHFRGVRKKKVIKTESVWMSKGALFMAATLESKRKPNSRSQVWMVQTLRWTGASGWEAKSVSNVALVKRRCIWSRNRKLILRRGFEGRISVIGHLVEVESANILRRGRGKREARITRDGRRKYIYIWFFLSSNSKKKDAPVLWAVLQTIPTQKDQEGSVSSRTAAVY